MEKINALVFAGGKIHDGKACGKEIRQILQRDERFAVSYIEEDLNTFTGSGLSQFEVMVFYYTVGEITRDQRCGLLDWVASGRGFVGIHSAADSFRDCPQYRAMIGGHFVGHPRYRDYQVFISDPEHPVTKGIVEAQPPEFFVKDEMYVTSYDARNHVLARALWQDGAVPVAWAKPWGKGRVVWLGLGHDALACRHEVFAKFVLRGALWAAEAAKQ